MRVAFIGCVEYSLTLLERVLEISSAEVVGVATRRASRFNADFCSLEPLAQRHGIDCLILDGNDQEALAAWLRRLEPEVAYCFGWSYLLRPEVLAIPSLGVIGFHPTELPLNRGRHPLIWALALGLTRTASTFFFMDEGADSGDILSQEPVPILPEDDAAALYARVTATALAQISAFTSRLAAGDAPRIPQDHSQATSWRKRTREDGRIDWRMPAAGIYNLVRALTHPYVGAHCVVGGEDVKVWRVRPESLSAPENAEPGKVLALRDREILVRCGDGSVWLCDHEFGEIPRPGTYL